MRKPRLPLLLAALAAISLQGFAQERDRAKIPDQYKWNLADIYPNESAWRAAKEKLQKELPEVGKFKGKLGASPSGLADALDRITAFQKDLSRVRGYASLLADEDTRDATHQGMRQEITQLASAFRAETAYVDPEILRLPKGTVDRFLSSEPRLKPYKLTLDDITRRAAHTLSESEERILADAGPLAGSPSATYNLLTNAEFPYPTVTLSDGRNVKIDQAGFTALRGVGNRADRQKVMSSFFEALGAFKGTFGTTMNAEVQKVLFLTKARKYPAPLDAMLDDPNIPVTVYTRLIYGINRQLPSFHRYLKLRKRMMGLNELHYYDLYAPLVDSVKLDYSVEEARKHVLAAVAPLGPDYQRVIQQAFDGRWIDFFPTPGKRSGGYSSGGLYDVHPYMLINYNGHYDDVSTLAHELGHTMQSYYSNKTQPYPLAGYPIFVAEVASTFNESLLNDYMLRTITDPATRLSLLGSHLETIKGTVFRQTQFAEFELAMHDMALRGQPITGEALSKLYMDITKRYYGHDTGVCVVDDYVRNEWAYIPHFYRDFYVFQYATSFTASSALAGKVKAGDPEARKRYLAFISAGGSKYPIELLKDAGVDMTTDEPLDLTIREMNHVMDEMEKILAAR